MCDQKVTRVFRLYLRSDVIGVFVLRTQQTRYYLFARFNSYKCWFREQQRFNSILDQEEAIQEKKTLATRKEKLKLILQYSRVRCMMQWYFCLLFHGCCDANPTRTSRISQVLRRMNFSHMIFMTCMVF